MLSSNISSTCLHNMANFGPLAAEIGPVVRGTPAKFQRLSRLGSITARQSSTGRQPNFAALNRGRHLYSAGRPSRWAWAHIPVMLCFPAAHGRYRTLMSMHSFIVYTYSVAHFRGWIVYARQQFLVCSASVLVTDFARTAIPLRL